MTQADGRSAPVPKKMWFTPLPNPKDPWTGGAVLNALTADGEHVKLGLGLTGLLNLQLAVAKLLGIAAIPKPLRQFLLAQLRFGAPHRSPDWYYTPSATGTRPGDSLAAEWQYLNLQIGEITGDKPRIVKAATWLANRSGKDELRRAAQQLRAQGTERLADGVYAFTAEAYGVGINVAIWMMSH